MNNTFDKSIGQLHVNVSEGWPRWVTIGHMNFQENPCDMQKLPSLSVEQMRDLHFALGRAISWVDQLGEKE